MHEGRISVQDGWVGTIEEEHQRTDQRDPVVRAWAHRHDLETIRALAASAPPGPLSGWTLGVKDVIDTADLPTERGSPIYAGRTTRNDAACVAVARTAGAIVVGKTRTTEFALFTPTVTTNPHHPNHTPGGSSSGSAAAVADGQVRAAFGTQTVGSVLRPAAYCGVVGFKPTRGLIPLTGVATLAWSLDTVGWFTNQVDDARVMLDALAGPTDAEISQPLRIGRYHSHQWPAADPSVVGVLDTATAALTAAGHVVIDVEPLPHLAELFAVADTILHYEIARVFAWEHQHHPDLISPLVVRMLDRATSISGSDYRAAQRDLETARRLHDAYLTASGISALLTPSAPGEAPDLSTTGDSVFNRVWTALGVPSVHLPVGRGPSGLPVGVQLTGRAWHDADLLASAHQAETAFSP